MTNWKRLYTDASRMLEVYQNEIVPGMRKQIAELDANNKRLLNRVEVVRCEDCIHREYVDMGDEIGAIGGCGLFRTPMMTCHDFCSYGERRT